VQQRKGGGGGYLEVAGHPVGQLLGEQGHLVVEVDGGGVLQQVVLLVDRLHHAVVAVAYTHRHNPRKTLRAKTRLYSAPASRL